MKTDLVQANTTLATVPAGESPELPPAQIAALDAILAGKTAVERGGGRGHRPQHALPLAKNRFSLPGRAEPWPARFADRPSPAASSVWPPTPASASPAPSTMAT